MERIMCMCRGGARFLAGPLCAASVICYLVAPLPARADDSGESKVLTLEAATARSVGFSPILKAAGEEVTALRARARQAGFWPNPEFGAEIEEFGWDRPWLAAVDTTFVIEQTIPLGDRLASSTRAEEAAGKVAEVEAAGTELAVRIKVRRDFVLALAARERLKTATAELDIATRLHTLVSQKAEAGEEAPAVLFRAEADLDLVRLEVSEAHTRLHMAHAALAGNWGGSAGEVGEVLGQLVPALQTTSLPVGEASATAPQVRRWQAKGDEHEARAKAASSEAAPDITVGGGLRGIDGFAENAFVLTLSVPIPVFDRNHGARDEARARARRARFLADASLADSVAEVARLRIELTGALERCRLVVEGVLPRLEAAAAAVEAGVEAGKSDLWDLLLARRRLLVTRVRLVNLATEYQLALLEFDHLTGRMAGERRDDNEKE